MAQPNRIVLGQHKKPQPQPQPQPIAVATKPHIGSIFDKQTIDGVTERGYNKDGQNKVQTANTGSTNGVREIENTPDGENYVTYLPDVNHMKIRNINTDNEVSQLTRNEDESYTVGDGTTLKENFAEGNEKDGYQAPQDVNLVQADENNKVKAEKISLGAEVGNTNETSTGDANGVGTYTTEAFFDGKDGKVVGIGVTTEDNNTAESAKAEIDKIANEFIKKEGDNTQSDYERALELCGDNEEAKKALGSFVDQLYDKNEATGKLTPKGNYDNVDTKIIRNAAQTINNQLRGKENVNEDDLNGLLKYMVGIDAAIRDLQEENSKQPVPPTTESTTPAANTPEPEQPQENTPTPAANVNTNVASGNTNNGTQNVTSTGDANINIANNGATDEPSTTLNVKQETPEEKVNTQAQQLLQQGVNENNKKEAEALIKKTLLKKDLKKRLLNAINFLSITQDLGFGENSTQNIKKLVDATTIEPSGCIKIQRGSKGNNHVSTSSTDQDLANYLKKETLFPKDDLKKCMDSLFIAITHGIPVDNEYKQLSPNDIAFALKYIDDITKNSLSNQKYDFNADKNQYLTNTINSHGIAIKKQKT